MIFKNTNILKGEILKMKIKRILSILLTLSMVLSLCSFTVATANTETCLYCWDGDSEISSSTAIAMSKKSSSLSFNSGAYSKSTGSNSSLVQVGLTADDGDKYFAINHYLYRNNMYSSSKYPDLNTIVSTTNEDGSVVDSATPVLHLTTTAQVPVKNITGNADFVTDEYVTARLNDTRYAVTHFSNVDNKASLYHSFKLHTAEDGSQFYGVSADLTGVTLAEEHSYPIPYTQGSWITIDSYIYRTSNGTLKVASYVGDTQIYYGETKSDLYSETYTIYRNELYSGASATPAPMYYKENGLYATDASHMPVHQPPVSDADKIEADIEALDLLATGSNLESSIILPTEGTEYGTTFSWTSSNPAVITTNGTVTKGEATETVTLTLTAAIGGTEKVVEYTYTVPAYFTKLLNYDYNTITTEKTYQTQSHSVDAETGEDVYKAVTTLVQNGDDGALNIDSNISSSTSYAFLNQVPDAEHTHVSYVGKNGAEGQGLAAFLASDVDGTKGSFILISNTRKNIHGYINDERDTVFHMYTDVYIPSGTENASRSLSWMFSTLTDTSTNRGRYHLTLDAGIRNGAISFSGSAASAATILETIDCTNRAEASPFTSDTWHTVEFFIKVSPNSDGTYAMNIYGVVDDVCYYEQEYALTEKKLALARFELEVGTSGQGLLANGFETGVDNLGIKSIDGRYYTDTFTKGFTNADYIYPLAVNYDDSTSTITAKGRVVNKGVNHCLVLAVYDASGKLLTLKPYSTPDNDGFMTVDITDASYITPGYKFKAFMFDSLTTIIPQVAAKEVIVPAGE